MTNAEKYLKDGVVAKELWKKFQKYYYKNKSKESDVGKAFINFFEQSVTPTLTEDERVILKNLNNKFNKIGRTDGVIQIRRTIGELSNWHCFCVYNHLFQFIKNGEEYSIEELLKGE